ncbi:MAG: hypothetical protein EWV80_15355 [Microcystis aeruginosa Ma_QC_B_20070730_S2]|uniref:Mobile element protein n=1 Tax=Microcystis aeruginosa Ma_QC_B_20070730_S2 TaxID=2486256 RepID=A0A552DHZ1_MICAE|nr:MAG: hypothetical protein EWV80_15355 [Microcystis aeruginosa Ma_QC_B_20070730_S2]
MGFFKGSSLLKSGVTFGFIAQSKLLGGSTPQTPRWGRGAAPKGLPENKIPKKKIEKCFFEKVIIFV